MSKKPFRLNARRRDGLIGLFFLTPFIIGTLLFFAFPVISSFLLSFGDIDIKQAGFNIELSGFKNYVRAFLEDTNYVPHLINAVKTMLIQTPLILIFSLLMAIMLNRVRIGRGFYRVTALFPFLLGTGQVLNQIRNEGIDVQILSLTESELIPKDVLAYFGTDFLTVIDSLFGVIVIVLWSCGVQTLLFLSAIQSISPALYESARIDGSNEYDAFWKITLPMIMPTLLLNTIYTIINMFMDTSNGMLNYIKAWSVNKGEYGFAAAMGWSYFGFILIFVSIALLTIGGYSRRLHGVTGGGKR